MISDQPIVPADLLSLARQALEWQASGRDPNQESGYARVGTPRGCFVSLKVGADDTLRGCIGTVEPVRPTLAEEIVSNSMAAASRDPRFPPVRPEEVPGLRISIDLLSPPEPVNSPEDLDPRYFGVIVNSHGRRGLLLPDLSGVDTAARQIAICREKAGIPAGDPVSLERFTVTRFSE